MFIRRAKRCIDDEYNRCESVQIPATDIEETEHAYILKAELPGVEKEGLTITVENKKLEIHGKVNSEENENKYIYSEFSGEDFQRSFTLSDGIDTEQINGEFKNGLLTLTLSKKEDVKPRKIPIAVH